MQHSQWLDHLDQAAIRSGAPRVRMTVRAGTRGGAGIHPALLAIMGLGEAHAEGYNPPQRAEGPVDHLSDAGVPRRCTCLVSREEERMPITAKYLFVASMDVD